MSLSFKVKQALVFKKINFAFKLAWVNLMEFIKPINCNGFQQIGTVKI